MSEIERAEIVERERELLDLFMDTRAYKDIVERLDDYGDNAIYPMIELTGNYNNSNRLFEVLSEARDYKGGPFRFGASHYFYDNLDDIVSLESYYINEYMEAAAADLMSSLCLNQFVELFEQLSNEIDADEMEEIEERLIEWGLY